MAEPIVGPAIGFLGSFCFWFRLLGAGVLDLGAPGHQRHERFVVLTVMWQRRPDIVQSSGFSPFALAVSTSKYTIALAFAPLTVSQHSRFVRPSQRAGSRFLSEGKVLADVFTSSTQGSDALLQTICRCTCLTGKWEVGSSTTFLH